MLQAIDRETHYHVEKIFKHLGNAINDLLVYTQEHPRFKGAIQKAEELVAAFFEHNAESGNLTFTFQRQELEFRNIPLVNVGVHGERLIQVMSECGCKALQFLPGVSAAEFGQLIRSLSTYVGPVNGRLPESLTAGGDSKYRFLYRLPEDELVLSEAEFSLDAAEANEPVAKGDETRPRLLGFRAAAEVARSVGTSYRPILANVTEGHTFNTGILQKASHRMVSMLADQDHRRIPAPLNDYFDDFTLNHSVNVCLIATRAASLVITDRGQLNRIAVAALLHDVGKSQVPQEILHKPGKLSEGERECLRNHASLGADILLSLRCVDPLSVTVAFGHHLRRSSFSLPEAGQAFEPNWVTKLIAVSDIFETLTAVRPYKSRLSPLLAFRTMLKMPKLKGHWPFVKLLYDSLGPYPVGTFLELTSGERAVVLEMNTESLAHPKVRILTDENGNRLKEIVDVDLAPTADGKRAAHVIARPLVRQTPSEDLVSFEARPEPDEILGSALEDADTLMAREG